ncbi:MAG: hypothetical protein IPL83_19245 [Bdellovibrionales bacterium]|nr:hypothetical protein [Bdellovibrionales bacterium]
MSSSFFKKLQDTRESYKEVNANPHIMGLGPRILISSLFLCLLSFQMSLAHEEHEPSDTFNIQAIVELYQLSASLSPKIMDENHDKNKSEAFLMLGNERIHLNSHFWQLVRAWVRIYQTELARDCVQCEFTSEEELLREAEDVVARGFFQTKIAIPLGRSLGQVAESTAEIGAQFGTVALLVKVASEVAETVASKLIGGAGVHVVCTAIDAVILFWTRHLQVAYRIPSWSNRLGTGSAQTSWRYWFASQAVKRAQKRVSFEFGPFELDEAGIKILDAEGSNRWWGFIGKSKRRLWLEYLKSKAEPLAKEISEIDSQLTEQPENQSLLKRKRILNHRLQKISSLDRRVYLGLRKKRLLFLRARQRGYSTFLRSEDGIDPALNHQMLWIIAVQEGLLHRGMISQESSPPRGDTPSSAQFSISSGSRVSKNQIIEGLANEYSIGSSHAETGEGLLERENRKILIQSLLTDVETIFDHSVPPAQRYLHTLIIEQTLVGFMYQMIKWQMDQQEPDIEKNWLGQIMEMSSLRTRGGRLVKFIYEYSDFLRVASVTKKPLFLSQYKYEAMESLMRIFRHLDKLGSILQEHSPLADKLTELKLANHQLLTYAPWAQKKTVYSWIPFLKPKLRCEDLWKAYL